MPHNLEQTRRPRAVRATNFVRVTSATIRRKLFSQLTGENFFFTYPLPWDFLVSALFQNISGPNDHGELCGAQRADRRLASPCASPANVNVYNVFNGSASSVVNVNYGSVVVAAVAAQDGRMVQFSGTLTFWRPADLLTS